MTAAISLPLLACLSSPIAARNHAPVHPEAGGPIAAELLAAGAPQGSISGEFARGVALFNEHDDTGSALDEAAEVFAGLLARQPRHAAARAYLGLIALERGDAPAADTAFSAALALDPKCAEAHVGRVRLLRLRSQWQASYDEARLAVRLAPNSLLARWELVNILCHRAESPVGPAEWREAEPHLLRILALDKTSRDAHMELGDVYRELDRCREAVPHYLAVLRIGQTPEDLDVWVYEVNRTVADCYERVGDRSRAADYLERYLRELRVVGAAPETISEVEQKLARLRR